jgi:hypothetical protein
VSQVIGTLFDGSILNGSKPRVKDFGRKKRRKSGSPFVILCGLRQPSRSPRYMRTIILGFLPSLQFFLDTYSLGLT